MRYGEFDNARREYKIDQIDLPVSWTNYIGLGQMYGVFNHTAGGYALYQSPEYHRITRFRPNGVPMDTPGHYLYLRDAESGDYWSVSWQPTAKPPQHYRCRHGLSYSRYLCDYSGISAEQRLYMATEDPVEIIELRLRNDSGRPRQLQVFSYLEFSFHHIAMDNQNFQMSLYASGSRYQGGVIEYDLYYEEDGYQFFTSSFEPDGYDCVREAFLGPYRTERDPLAVERGQCSQSAQKGGNHCACLQKNLCLAPGQQLRLLFLLGEGGLHTGAQMRQKYTLQKADEAFAATARFWDERLRRLQVRTPEPAMDTELNIWNLYQSAINVRFSRFTSFIEVGGRVGLGYRDTAQDAMTLPHAEPQACRQRLLELLAALTWEGYGLHLFEPRWFAPQPRQQSFRSPTVVPTPPKSSLIHGIEDACADDALWLVAAVAQYIRETGDDAFASLEVGYAGGERGTVYQHLQRILDFSARQVGANGICKGLRADWNDCLNLGGGESAMVSFLHHWALGHFVALARHLGRLQDAAHYQAMAEAVKARAEAVLWDDGWYIRGITADGRRIGTHADAEGRVHIESNTWAVLSGVASRQRGLAAMDSVDQALYTPYGLRINAPSYTKPDDGIGFVTRVYPGLKENGSVFSHPNPWAWCAEAMLGRGSRAMKFYRALCPAAQNDRIEVRKAEPYAYCQFIAGPDHTAFGRAHHPFMTGSAGWAYYAATQYLLGVRPDFDRLVLDPCIPASWPEFWVHRVWRGALYHIHVRNPHGAEKGVAALWLDGRQVEYIPPLPAGSEAAVEVCMGPPAGGRP